VFVIKFNYPLAWHNFSSDPVNLDKSVLSQHSGWCLAVYWTLGLLRLSM